MAQFFHSCQQYSVCDKSLKLYKEDFIKDLTPLVKYIKACPDIINKDINMLVALLPTLKIFFFFKFESHRSRAARSCSFKKGIVKNFEKLARKCLESLFWKIRIKREKRNSSTGVFPWVLPIFFRTLIFKIASGWLLLRAVSRRTYQNFVSFQGKHLRRSSAIVKPLALRFAPILLINLKLRFHDTNYDFINFQFWPLLIQWN